MTSLAAHSVSKPGAGLLELLRLFRESPAAADQYPLPAWKEPKPQNPS